MITNEGKVLYFGYGANASKRMMTAITENENLVGRPARLESFKLCVQKLGQVPDEVLATAPIPVSPRALLKESSPPTFESYVIQPGAPDDFVVGTVWELTLLERELVEDWELIPFGWYQPMAGKATILDQEGDVVEVVTEGLGEGQEFDRVVNGEQYPRYLNPVEDFERVAHKAREEFFARQSV